MMRSPPKIDPRDFLNLLQEIRELVPFYTAEWQVSDDNNSGSALLKIFAHMLAGTIGQLNQVPEKNYIAFLNLLGMKLRPARPSRVPVTFKLSPGATKYVLIPAKTKLSTDRKNEQNGIFFETENNLLVTPAELVALYSVNSNEDSIFAAPHGFFKEKPAPFATRLLSDGRANAISLFLEDTSEIQSGDILKIVDYSKYEYLEVELVSNSRVTFKAPITAAYPQDTTVIEKVINLELFFGKNKQERILYLGDLELFNITENIPLILNIEPQISLTKLADPNLVNWEYWGEDRETQTLKWHSFNSFTIDADRLVLEKSNGDRIQETEINGVKSRWIRCKVLPQLSPANLQEIEISKIEAAVITSGETETRPRTLDYCLTFNNLQYQNKTEASKAGLVFLPFQPLADRDRAIYLGFDAPALEESISMFFSLVSNSDRENHKGRSHWQYYRRELEIREWAELQVRDRTNSLTQSGIVELMLPADLAKVSLFGQLLYWIRIVPGEERFKSRFDITCKGIYLNTTWATQTETIDRENVGSSNGKADQSFTLFRSPVLSEEVWVNELNNLTIEEREKLLTLARANKIELEEIRDNQDKVTQFWVKWTPKADFFDSVAEDRHYQIDRRFGIIKFGNGTEGAIPPAGSRNIQVTYQVGGGTKGNLDRFEINRLNSSIAFINQVTNPEPAEGGWDGELLEEVLERGPQILKNRDRAVTAEDFERLLERSSKGLARVKCLPNINKEGKTELGWVSSIVVPQSSAAKPMLSLALKQEIEKYLEERSANTLNFVVKSPTYIEIAIAARIVAIAFEAIAEIELMARQKLSAFLHPLTGGYKNRGWEFGRSPCKSDFYQLLGSIPNVDRVESLSIIVNSDRAAIKIPPDGLVTSGRHQIEVVLNS